MSEKRLRLYISPRHFVVNCTQLQGISTGQADQLVIDRSSGVCKTTSQFSPLIGGVTRDQLYFIDVFGLLGLITVGAADFLAVITEASQVASLRESPILTINSLEFIPLEPHTLNESSAEQLQGVTHLLSTGFYFSYGYDLTNSLQRQLEGSSGTIHDRSDARFYWNSEMYKDFSSQGVDTKWFLPAVQGYVGTATHYIADTQVTMVLISRRSCCRVDCSSKGIDSDGNVHNFVETEQIIIAKGCCFSLLHIRGSVPVFWQQPDLTMPLTLTRSRESTSAAFLKHISSIVGVHKHFLFINLLSSTNSSEQLLTEGFEFLMKQHKVQLSQVCSYVYFDYFSMCQGNPLYNLQDLLARVQVMMNYYTFFCIRKGAVVSSQKGVMRINCLDCLDRTNAVMSQFAWHSLRTQLSKVGVDLECELDSSTNPFAVKFKELWGYNGDMLSLECTGLGSTSGASRVFQATVVDDARQRAVDLVLHRRASRARLVRGPSTEYSNATKLTMQVCTWNLAGRKPPLHENLLSWLLADSQVKSGTVMSRPDILVVGFQEIIKLNARNALPGANTSTVATWNELLRMTLQQSGDRYTLLKEESMFGCLITVFAKTSIASHITRVESDRIKTGFKGSLGNKGSVMVRFNAFDTSVCVWNCHLASGNDQVAARCSQLEDIEMKGFKKDSTGQAYSVNKHDVKILFGDLNFRIDLSNFDVRRLCHDGDMQSLLQHDQMLKIQPQHRLLSRYFEPRITFPPTYKYDVNTQIFDSSKKQRAPAWCDRILYSGTEVYAHAYGRTELLYSDHRPVYATFELRVKAALPRRQSMIEMDDYSPKKNRFATFSGSRPMVDYAGFEDPSAARLSRQGHGRTKEYSLL
jgi:phosphatidylinositol-bisphosphatase